MTTLQILQSRYGAFPPQYYSGEVRWEHWDFLFIHKGELNILTKEGEIQLRQDDAILIPPDNCFKVQNRGTTATASVQYFLPAEGSTLSRKLASHCKPLVIQSRKDLNVKSHVNELMGLYRNKEEVTRRQELLLELIVEKVLLSGQMGQSDKTPMDDLIEKYCDRGYEIPSVESLAEEAGYSASRFSTLFQEHKGMPPGRYFLNKRMERGASLLTETTLPIKTIAYRCGYGEVSHFNRAFTQYFDLTPARYRKENLIRG